MKTGPADGTGRAGGYRIMDDRDRLSEVSALVLLAAQLAGWIVLAALGAAGMVR